MSNGWLWSDTRVKENEIVKKEINKKLDKQSRKEINKTCINILEKWWYSTDASKYTIEEIETLKRYSWVWWLNEASDTWVWSLTEFFTPTKIINKLWGLAWKYWIKWWKAFEPSTWIWWIISKAPKWFILSWIELSKISWTIAKVLNPTADIKIWDFYDMFIWWDYFTKKSKIYNWEKKNLIIWNPPYFKRIGKNANVDSHLKESQDYFVSKWLDMLEDNWLLVYVVNNWFLSKKWAANLKSKKDIASKWTLVDAYRLPSWLFNKEWTWISTEIIVIRKKPWNVNDFIKDNFFEKNPDKLLYDEIKWEWQFKKFIWDESQLDNIDTTNKQKETSFKPLKDVKWKDSIKAPKEKNTSKKKRTVKEKLIWSRKKETKIDTHKELVITDKKISNNTQDLLDRTWFNFEVVWKTDIKKWEPVNYDNNWIIYDDFYFSWDIYSKLSELENNKQYIIDNFWETQYNKQKTWLEKVKPTPKTINDIELSYKNNTLMNIQNEWSSVMSDFRDWIRYDNADFSFWISKYDVIAELNWWRVSLTKYQRQQLPNQINRYLNIFKDEMSNELVQEIENIYNKRLNSFVETDYSKLPFINKDIAKEFNWTEFEFTEIQKEWIKRLIYKWSWLIAYWVGVWKTHTLLWATKWLLDAGRIKRPMFIVPKATLSKTWINTIKKMYPLQNLVNLSNLSSKVIKWLKKEFWENPSEWIKDWDMVIISYEWIKKLWLEVDNIVAIENTLSDILTIGSKKQKEIDKETLSIEEIISTSMKWAIEGIKIEDLWIDHLSVDEVHNFRKVFQWSKTKLSKNWLKETNRFSNVIWWKPSKRAQKLFLLSQYIQSKNWWRWVFLASATPFENQATEVYNIISLIWYQRLKELWITNINDFYWTFADYKPELVRKWNWTYETKEVFEDFSNKPELQKIIREFIDYREDKHIIRPDKIVKTPYLTQSSEQAIIWQKIIDLAFSDKDWSQILASQYWKINASSPYFIREYFPDHNLITPEKLVENSPKLKYTFNLIKSLKEDHPDKWHFIYFWEIWADFKNTYKQYFIDKWLYKENEIWVIWWETKNDKREIIKDKFNNWEIKILIWWWPTKEWIDLQKNWISTHIIWLWWNPTEMTQVEWRVWRQWNPASKVHISYPLVENSNDIIMFQKFKEKWWRIASLFDYTTTSKKDVKIDYKEQLIALVTDPKDKVSLKMDIEKVKLENEKFFQKNLRDKLKLNAKIVKENTEYMKNLKKDLEEDVLLLNEKSKKLKTYKKDKKLFADDIVNIEYRINNIKIDIKKTKDYIKTEDFSLDRAKTILEWFWIKDLSELEEKTISVNKELKEIEEKIYLLPKKGEEMLNNFIKEKKEYERNKKTPDEYINEIRNDLSWIEYFTKEQLAKKKQTLINKDFNKTD